MNHRGFHGRACKDMKSLGLGLLLGLVYWDISIPIRSHCANNLSVCSSHLVGSGWLNDLLSIVWKMEYSITGLDVDISLGVQREIIQSSLSESWSVICTYVLYTMMRQCGRPHPRKCMCLQPLMFLDTISLLMYVYTMLRVSSCGYTQALSTYFASSLSASRGSRSARVQVAHGDESRPGSRLATPVAIWCWQFTQAFFSTAPWAYQHRVSLSQRRSISRPRCKK